MAFTVPTEACTASLNWTGVEPAFPAGFSALDPSHILCNYTSGVPAVTIPLIAGVHIAVACDPVSGAVTVTPIAMPPAPGKIIIDRHTPATSVTNFANLASYNADAHTIAADVAAMGLAEARRDIGRVGGQVTGAFSYTAHAVLLGEGLGSFGLATVGTPGRLLIDQGNTDPAFVVMSGHVNINAVGLAVIQPGVITNAMQVAAPAWTFKGNPTNGVATPADVTIDGLTLKASPVPGDEVMIWDTVGLAWKKTTVSGIGAGGTGVASIAGNVGTFTLGAGLANSVNVILADPTFHQNYIGGLVVSNDIGTPNTVIDVAAGVACSDDATVLLKLPTFTKNCSAAWAVGSGNGALDAGNLTAATWYHVYVIARTDTGVVDVLISEAPPSLTQALTSISNAAPAVCSAPSAHGLQSGQPVKFTTTGGLPAGLAVGTQYFVLTAGLTATAFEVALTVGGAAINTSSAGSGTHSVVTAPILPANYSVKRRVGSFKTDGATHILPFTQTFDVVVWAAQFQEFNVGNPGAAAVARTLAGVPPGVPVLAHMSCLDTNAGTGHWQLFSALSSPDVAPSVNAFTNGAFGTGLSYGGSLTVMTSAAGQIRTRQSASAGGDLIQANTIGYRDFRL